MRILLPAVILLLSLPSFGTDSDASANSQHYAARLYTHLTGAPPRRFDPRFYQVVEQVDAGQLMSAVKIIQSDPNFLKVRVRNFSIPFVVKDFQPKDTLTDLQALIIGITRDELDARLILTGNLRYSGYPSLGLPAVSRANNDHYAQFEAQDLDFERDLQRVDRQWDDMPVAAGAFTTRAWAAAFYDAGTNRRAVQYTTDAFLCEPIKGWKIRGLPDIYVRRDIDRAPGGDPVAYQNDCRSCHAAMDGLGGAFAKMDFVNGAFVYQNDGVVAKMNKNTYFYPLGYVTTDDSWVNLLENHPTIGFGWRGPNEGTGIAAFASLIANAKDFSRCMVKKVFGEVCGKTIQDSAPELMETMAQDFEGYGYNLKELFARVAIQNACIQK